MDLIITILPGVTSKDLTISPRFTPYDFLSRCKFSNLTRKGMAESFSREKLRQAPQKEGGLKILCDLPPV